MEMKTEDYFLNCKTEESIKTRFKLLATKLHPDKNPGDVFAKSNFQEMIKQRDIAYKKIYYRSDFSENEINSKLEDFVKDLDSFNFSNLNNITKDMSGQIHEIFGDNPTFSQVFKHVLGGLFKAEENKNKKLGSSVEDNKKDQ